MTNHETHQRTSLTLGLLLLVFITLAIQTCGHELRLDNVEYWREMRERR